MNFSAEHVDLIVQRVLEHLGTPGGHAPGATSATSSSSASLPVAAPKGVRITESVVTQALLAETINGAKQVRIGPAAILTPSARDFIRNYGIEIIRESSSRATSTDVR